MGEESEPYLENFFDVTEPTPGTAFRWSSGRGRIRLGELLELPLPSDRGPLRLTARLSSGRPELQEPLPITWYLDLAIRERQRQLAVTPVGADWTDVTVELDPALVRRDSYLELQSPRPPVGEIHPGGYLGHMMMSLRIE